MFDFLILMRRGYHFILERLQRKQYGALEQSSDHQHYTLSLPSVFFAPMQAYSKTISHSTESFALKFSKSIPICHRYQLEYGRLALAMAKNRSITLE